MDTTPSTTEEPWSDSARHRPELRHQPALDGLRGVAVLAVLLFHAGVSWAGGGWLGVEVFFVLSGYLITSLLLVEWQGSGRVALSGFWARRARRLLPALFVLVIACALYEAIVGPSRAAPGFSADGLSTLFYVANWHQVWTGAGYFVQTGVVSPLQHTWSLAIEEQFYVIWPLAVIGALRLGRRLGQGRRPATALVPALALAGLGSLASAGEMAWLYHGGSGLNRVYYGTDTRASGLLVGATVAIAMAIRQQSARPAPVRPVQARRLGPVLLGLVGLAGAAGVGLAVASAGPEPAWIFEGGMLGIDLATAAVILACVAATSAASPLRAILSTPPLRATGLISYGLYLWHFPLFLWLTGPSTGLAATPLLWFRLGATLAVSVASYVLVEQPIRQRRLPSLAVRALAPVALAASLTAVLVAGEVTTVAAVRPVHLTTSRWEGTAEPGCRYKVAGLAANLAFHTCPPVKVMLVGDSIALTLGLDLGVDEQRYGVLVNIRALLGCGFSAEGQPDDSGTGYGGLNPGCATEYGQWRAVDRTYQPSVVLVEQGYWDEMNWRWGSGDDVHLGMTAFDAAVKQRMEQFVREFSARGQQIIFLTVPWTDPAPWPNGQAPPQSDPSRHRLINSLLASVAAAHPQSVHLFDIAPYVTPAGHYQASVGGDLCRTADGIHFYLGPNSWAPVQSACVAHLQAALFPFIRELVRSHPAGVLGGRVDGSVASGTNASSGSGRVPGSSPTTTQPNWQGTAEPGCRYPIPAFHTDPLFHTCPPVKVLFVGDSIALTMGVESTIGEEHYGVRIGGGVLLGCSFMTQGQSDELGQGYGRPSPPCLSELSTWRQDEQTFKPDAVVVEMGYWDEMNWLWGSGDYTHLGVPSFDAALRTRIDQVVQALSAGGRPVVLLTVPWVDPGPWPNGEVEPQATAVRHQLINQLLASVAAAHPGSVHLFDVSPYITPSGQYQSDVGGEICRAPDGIHLYIGPVSGPYSQTVCGADLQAALLPFVRGLVSARQGGSSG